MNTETEAEDKKIEYRILISPETYNRLLWYVDNCENEISGLCDVEFDRDRMAFVVGTDYMLKQEVSPGSTVIDPDAIAELYHRLVTEGHDVMPRLWWHSHAKMNVFWSGTDYNCMENEFVRPDYSIAIVFNHKHESKTRVMVWNPVPVVFENVPLVIDYKVELDEPALKAEMDAKVSTYTRTTTSYNYSFPKDYSLGDDYRAKIQSKKEKKRFYSELPRTRSKALEKIKALKLRCIWDRDLINYTWYDFKKDQYWFDRHLVLKMEDIPENAIYPELDDDKPIIYE